MRIIDKEEIRFRVIGFWNPVLKKHHWYLTNLKCEANLILPLYKMRWQIELLIKSAKQSINLNQIPSKNKNIIINLCIARLVALTIALLIRRIGVLNISMKKQSSISLQRAAMALSNLSKDLINFIIHATNESKNILRKKLKVLIDSLYDPNHNKRDTTMESLIKVI